MRCDERQVPQASTSVMKASVAALVVLGTTDAIAMGLDSRA
jgi:hypothetical protein